MIINFAQWLFIFIVLGSILSAMLCQIILRLTLDKRVRKALPTDKDYDSFFDGYFGIMRTSLFANACIPFMRGAKNNMEIFYGGFDVASFATSFEKTIAYIHLISFCIGVLCIPIFFITEWLGIFKWPDT